MTPTNPPLTWIKSSRSLTSYDWKCIELARFPDGNLGIRDSKNKNGSVIRLPRAAGRAFINFAANTELSER